MEKEYPVFNVDDMSYECKEFEELEEAEHKREIEELEELEREAFIREQNYTCNSMYGLEY